MELTDLLGKAIRSVGLGLVLYLSGCGGSSSSGCQTDYDCREPRVCRQGECIDPNEGEAESESDQPTYTGMCEDYIQVLIENNCSLAFHDKQDHCNSLCEPVDQGSHRMYAHIYCAEIYCCVEQRDCTENGIFSNDFRKCVGRFDLTTERVIEERIIFCGAK